jgi:predicted nucleic acid-binding protein
MVACDTTFLSLILKPDAKPPLDAATEKPVERVGDRIEKLIEDLQEANERLIIPTPVLAEFLVLADKSGPQYLDTIAGEQVFSVRPFDEKAAIEFAAMELGAKKLGDKRGGSKDSWARVKFDRQIVAIAKANGASRIYSDDEDVRRFAQAVDIEVIGISGLPLPAAKQMKLEDQKGFLPEV